jgi:hypothetical protein
MPSETVGCRRSSSSWADRVLVVNAFTRFDRTLNLRQTPGSEAYKPPGHNGNTGTMQRVLPRRVNSFDYVVPHGDAISAAGYAFDSCQVQAITNNQVILTNYTIAIWACGNESVNEETFGAQEQSRIASFLAGNGSLFVSGSDVAYDLGRPSGSTAADRDFFQKQLHAIYGTNNSSSYAVSASASGALVGLAPATIDDGSKGIYWVPGPDVLLPNGVGARTALTYGSGASAAVQYDGSAGGGRVFVMGFPLETITDGQRRRDYLKAALGFLTPPRFRQITILADQTVRLVVSGEPGVYQIQQSLDSSDWKPLTNVTITSGPLQIDTAMSTDSMVGFVRMVRIQ